MSTYSVISPTVAVTLVANTAVLVAVPPQGSFNYTMVTVNTTGVAWILGSTVSTVTAASAVSVAQGPIATHGSITGGSVYTTGTYTGVNLSYVTSGTGSGAVATIVVAAGAVTTVTITNGGSKYQVNDSLTATAAQIGGTGSGFHVPVATLTNVGGFSATSVSLPAAGSWPIALTGSTYLSLISTGTPTISLTFS